MKQYILSRSPSAGALRELLLSGDMLKQKERSLRCQFWVSRPDGIQYETKSSGLDTQNWHLKDLSFRFNISPDSSNSLRAPADGLRDRMYCFIYRIYCGRLRIYFLHDKMQKMACAFELVHHRHFIEYVD